MPPRGTYAKPLLEKLLDTCLSKYENCLIPDSEDFLSIEKQNLKPIKSFEELIKFPYIVNKNVSLQEIRKKSKRLIETFKNIPNADIFVVGDFNAMKFSSLLSLYFLENNLKNKFVAIPCCPFNSIPFTEFSAGFLSALNWSKNMAEAFLKSGSGMKPGIGIMEIKGDETGWLTVGTAALSNFPNQTLFLAPDIIFDDKVFLIELKKIINKNKTVLIIVGETLKIKSDKRIIHQKQNVAQIISKIISKAGFSIFNFQIAPGILFDEAHISKHYIKMSRSFATAAVKFAKKSKGNIMVVNRLNFSRSSNFSFEAIPLYDAVTTPRKFPGKFHSKNYRVTMALKNYLELIRE